MNIVLVDNLVMPERRSLAELNVQPHLGLLALAAAAESAGHTVSIYDPKRAIRWGQLSYDSSLYDRAAEKILSSSPDAVGFTTLGCSFIFATRVAAVLKRIEPDLPILLGGPHATMLHREILEKFCQFDVVVRYEADQTFAIVLERLEARAFEDIPAVSWRLSARRSVVRCTDGKPKVENLDALPITSYEHYPIAELGLDHLPVEAGRGCPFNCTFCSTAAFFQRSFRLKSADRLVRELDILHARYGFSDFKLDHDMFTANRRKVVDFCEAVKDRGYRWRVSARVDCVDEDLLTTMARSGCVGLYFGIETGSVRMQEICKKRLDLDLVQPILDATSHLGIETTVSFIAGYPEELEQDHNDTIDMIGRCFRPGCLPQLHILAPEPGTPMFDQYKSTLAYDGYGGPYNAEVVDEEDRRLILDHSDIFSTYYYYPAEMPRVRYIFSVETLDLLRRVGPIVVQYVLRAYGGRLSKWLDEFRHFAELSVPSEPPSAQTLEAHVASRFGSGHHVTSLFRYGLRANSHRIERDGVDLTGHAIDSNVPYKLNPKVDFLADLHDCRFLIERISRMPSGPHLLDEFEAGERALYLIGRGTDGPTLYRIGADCEAILRLFERPRTIREVIDGVRQGTGGEELWSGFFDDLAQARIIVPVAVPQISRN